MQKLVKRKNTSSKGNVRLKPRKKKEQEEGVAYVLTDIKETIITENSYQPIPLSILKQYMVNGMIK